MPPLTQPTTALARRGYQRPNRCTPLIEHYLDDDNQDQMAGPDAEHAARARNGILGRTSSPATWRLDPGSPVYGLAKGELVAARFARSAGVVSMSFLLVRHLVFHQTVGGADPVQSLRPARHRPSTRCSSTSGIRTGSISRP